MSDCKDIKHGWRNVARRMQSKAKSGGLSLISIVVLVDQDGNPKFWTEPSQRKIEPRMASRETLRMLHEMDSLGEK